MKGKKEISEAELLVGIGASFLQELQSNATLRRSVINSAPALVKRLKIIGIEFDSKTTKITPVKPKTPKKGLMIPIKTEA